MTPNEIINKALVGQVLSGLEFGQNEGDGSRKVTLMQKITQARLYFDGEDNGIEVTLENGEQCFVYAHEEMYS